MRSWMGAKILKVLANRAQAPAALVHSGVQQLEMEHKNWDEDILKMGLYSCCTTDSPIWHLRPHVSLAEAYT